MIRKFKISGILMAAALAILPAMKVDAAGLIMYEPFDYPDGDALAGKTVFGAEWGALEVLATAAVPTASELGIINAGDTGDGGTNSLGYTGLETPVGGRLNATVPPANSTLEWELPTPVTGDGNSLYASFLFKPGVTQSGGQYIIHLRNVNAGGANAGRGRFRAEAGTGGTHTFIAQWRGTGINFTAVTDAPAGTTIFFVLKFTIVPIIATNDTHDIWVNPPVGGAEPAPDGTATNDQAGQDIDPTEGFTGFRFRMRTAGPDYELDELRLGDTWESVTPGTASVMDWRDSSLPRDPAKQILSSLKMGSWFSPEGIFATR